MRNVYLYIIIILMNKVLFYLKDLILLEYWI